MNIQDHREARAGFVEMLLHLFETVDELQIQLASAGIEPQGYIGYIPDCPWCVQRREEPA